MVFTSHIFIFYFLPIVLLAYYALPRGRNLLLLIVSYAFYAWWDPRFVLLMFFATFVNYLCGRVIAGAGENRRRATAALVVAAVASLGLLGFFKYCMFVEGNLNRLLPLFGADALPMLQITLPVGISFYIFQSLSYPIDVYRGISPPVRSLWDFACFVALFPQLIAGPIVRYNTVAAQLVERSHTLDKFSSGVALFILGFAKKLMLANSVAHIADAAFAAEAPGAIDAWVGVTAYAFQIYFDFSGYSDMAIGLGRMIGFEFPRNFDSPYLSESITDFWRRWHISLSTFLRDYLYIPLGGNRKGQRRTYVNLTVTMLLGGLWHGANWTFIFWGAFHGAVLAFERMLGKKSLYAWAPKPIRIALTFVLVLISWVFFRSETLTDAMTYLGAMFGANGVSGGGSILLSAELYQPGRLIEMGLCALLAFGPLQAFDWVKRLSWPRSILLVGLFCLSIVTMFTQAFNPFLYFQF
ncbi:MAG: MBOAT family protein [Phycisphaerae bacterium]|nr:MBOAT family protein [Phycisphaerae bacterium]